MLCALWWLLTFVVKVLDALWICYFVSEMVLKQKVVTTHAPRAIAYRDPLIRHFYPPFVFSSYQSFLVFLLFTVHPVLYSFWCISILYSYSSLQPPYYDLLIPLSLGSVHCIIHSIPLITHSLCLVVIHKTATQTSHPPYVETYIIGQLSMYPPHRPATRRTVQRTRRPTSRIAQQRSL